MWPGYYIRITGFIICNNICSQPHLRTLPTLSRYPNSAGLDDVKTLLTLSGYPDSAGLDDVKTLLTLSGYPDSAGTDDVKTLLTLSGYPEHAQDIASFRISQQRQDLSIYILKLHPEGSVLTTLRTRFKSILKPSIYFAFPEWRWITSRLTEFKGKYTTSPRSLSVCFVGQGSVPSMTPRNPKPTSMPA